MSSNTRKKESCLADDLVDMVESWDISENSDLLMSPNTLKKESFLADDLVDMVESWDISKNDQIDIVFLSLKKLGLGNKLNRFDR